MRTSSFFAEKPSSLMRVKIDRIVAEFRGGIHRSVLSGKGIEFKRLRPYSPLDPPTAIDDMASSRLSEDPILEPYSRVRYTTKQVSTLVLLDVGETMRTPQIKEERAALVFWFLALSAFKYLDRLRVVPYALHPLDDSGWVDREDELTEFITRYGALLNPLARFSSARSVYSYISRLELHDTAIFVLSDFVCSWNDEPAELGRLGSRERNVKLVFCIVDEWEEFTPSGYSIRLYDPRRGSIREYSSGELDEMRTTALAKLAALEENLRPLGVTLIRFPVLCDPFFILKQSLRRLGFK